MAGVIPYFDIASFSEEVILEELPYVFRFTFNDRKQYWTMSILTRDRKILVAGIKLVLNYDLFDQFPGNNLPPGQLLAIDTTDSRVKINRTNILDVMKIVYFEKEEADGLI